MLTLSWEGILCVSTEEGPDEAGSSLPIKFKIYFALACWTRINQQDPDIKIPYKSGKSGAHLFADHSNVGQKWIPVVWGWPPAMKGGRRPPALHRS
jgi:hypothetical protein